MSGSIVSPFRPASWRLNKARSLLKLLALAEGNRMHRDAVVEALWPGLELLHAPTICIRRCMQLVVR